LTARGNGPMATLLTTNSELLAGLADPANAAIWEEFDRRYRPVLLAFARRLGLAVDDAADVVQETLAAFVVEYRAGRYERDRGRLRSWLFAIARARVAAAKRRADPRRKWRGESALEGVADEATWSELFEAQWRAALLKAALAELTESTRTDERTLAAFRRTTLEREAPSVVAAALGMTVNAVYLARHHVLAQLKEIVARLEQEW